MIDPWFAWLHELSQFIVVVDETWMLTEPATPGGRRAPPAQGRTLVAPNEGASGSRRKSSKRCSGIPASSWRIVI